MKNAWWQSLIGLQADGPALSNSTAATSILNGQAKQTLPAQFLDTIGSKLLLRASGKISTAASAPGTLTLALMLGSTAVFSTGPTPTLAVSAANLTWDLEVLLTARSVGSGTGATLYGVGKLLSAALAAATPIMLVPASSPAAGNGFDSTISNLIDLYATWSVASASNSITCQQFDLTSVN